MISAQNGLNELSIAEVVGEARTVGAFVNFGADYLEPGVVLYGGRGTVAVGEAFGPADSRLSSRALGIRDAWRDFDDRALLVVVVDVVADRRAHMKYLERKSKPRYEALVKKVAAASGCPRMPKTPHSSCSLSSASPTPPLVVNAGQFSRAESSATEPSSDMPVSRLV